MKKLQQKLKTHDYKKSMSDIQKNDKVPLHLLNQRELNIQYGGG